MRTDQLFADHVLGEVESNSVIPRRERGGGAERLLSMKVCAFLVNQAHSWETHHALFPYHGHPVLNTVHPIGDLREVVFPQSFLAGVKSAVVTACCGQIATAEKEKERKRMMRRQADRRRLPGVS